MFLPSSRPPRRSIRCAPVRARLINATDLVEEALITHPEGTIAWRSNLRDVIASLAGAWDRHTQGSEQPDGLLAQLEMDVPSLAPKVEWMRREHRKVASTLRDTLALSDDPTAEVDEVQHAVATCLGLVDTPRRRGGALVDQAYWVDIGGGGCPGYRAHAAGGAAGRGARSVPVAVTALKVLVQHPADAAHVGCRAPLRCPAAH